MTVFFKLFALILFFSVSFANGKRIASDKYSPVYLFTRKSVAINSDAKIDHDVVSIKGNVVFWNYKKLGVLKVLEVEKLFSWIGETEDKKINYLKENGLTEAYFNALFYENIDPSMMRSGKGFYVSTNPSDSVYYGDILLSFDVDRPLVTLEFDEEYLLLLQTRAQLLEFLSRSGVDAIRFDGYQPTWMALISGKLLRKPTDELLNEAQLFEVLSKDTSVSNSFLEKPIIKKAMENVNPYLLAYKLFREKGNLITFADMIPISHLLTESDLHRFNIFSIDESAITSEKDLELALKILEAHRSSSLRNNSFYSNIRINKNVSLLADNQSPENKMFQYDSLFEFMDLSDMLSGIESLTGTDKDWESSFNEILSKATKLRLIGVRAEMISKFNSIQSFSEFSSFLSEYFDSKFEIRPQSEDSMKFNGESSLVVSNSAKKTILTNEDLKVNESSSHRGSSRVSILFSNSDTLTTTELDKFFKIDQSLTLEKIFELYQKFVSLYVYGNGKNMIAAAFYFKYLIGKSFFSIRNNGNKALFSEVSLNLPMFKMSLFANKAELGYLGMEGSLIRAWVRKARSHKEFKERIVRAREILVKLNPDNAMYFSKGAKQLDAFIQKGNICKSVF